VALRDCKSYGFINRKASDKKYKYVNKFQQNVRIFRKMISHSMVNSTVNLIQNNIIEVTIHVDSFEILCEKTYSFRSQLFLLYIYVSKMHPWKKRHYFWSQVYNK